MTFILRILFNALGLILISELVDGIHVDGLYPAIIAVIILSLLNVFVRPILLILTLPITIVTIGLFAFVINAALFMFAASFIDQFRVDSFWYALLGSVLMSVVSTLGNRFINQKPVPVTHDRVTYREVE